MAQRLDRVYRRKRKDLLGYIRSRIADAVEAEDILQSVFVQAVENMNAAQPIDNLVGWLYTAARNRIIDHYRKVRSRQNRFPTISLNSSGEDEQSLEGLIKDSGLDLETEFIRKQVAEALIDCLEELPWEQREVFLLQTVGGSTFREISERSGTSINTLLSRKRYAVQFLRRRLADIKDVLAEIE